MGQIGSIAAEAKSDQDLVRLACIADKQQRAADVMQLGTTEILIARDATSSTQARTFAAQKLAAAGERLATLVDEAKACAGEEGPEELDDATRTDADEPRTVPFNDPSAGLGVLSPVPPAGADVWPPVASPFE